MNRNIRILSFLLVIMMAFTLTGCPATMPSGPLLSTGTMPSVTAPTGTTAPQYDEAYITALIERLEEAKSAALENYDAAWAVVLEDLLANYPSETLESLVPAKEEKMQAILADRTAKLNNYIDALQNADRTDAATVAEAEALISEEHHEFNEPTYYSGNTPGVSCAEADFYQICAKCNALKWSKGEHSWYYARSRFDHQMRCQRCEETKEASQHNTNEQGRCADCNYLLNANILIIESIEGESAAILGMLDGTHSLTVANVHNPAQLPTSAEVLQAYDEVILCNIANADLPTGFDQLLHTYVHDLGGSLFTVGGDNACDPADMQGTVYQEMLPVDMTNYVPSLGVMIIIDRSGSMYDPSSAYPYEASKLYAAKQGAIACLDALTEYDYVGVMSMGDDYEDYIKMLPLTQRDKIIDAIDDIQYGGGTVLSPALEMAGRKLNALTEVDNKHIIIITDGEFDANDQERYLYAFQENAKYGITTSIVGIQCHTAVQKKMQILLDEYAGSSPDNFYHVSELSTITTIMRSHFERPELREISYESFIPTIDPTHPIAANIGELPALSGFYGSKLKEGATAILNKGNVPLYAQWEYGNGTVGSFMCDLNGTWSSDFIASDVGADIISNIVSHLANAAHSASDAPAETPEPANSNATQSFAAFPGLLQAAWKPANYQFRKIR